MRKLSLWLFVSNTHTLVSQAIKPQWFKCPLRSIGIYAYSCWGHYSHVSTARFPVIFYPKSIRSCHVLFVEISFFNIKSLTEFWRSITQLMVFQLAARISSPHPSEGFHRVKPCNIMEICFQLAGCKESSEW